MNAREIEALTAAFVSDVERILRRRGGQVLFSRRAGRSIQLTGRHCYGIVSSLELQLINDGWVERIKARGRRTGPQSPNDVAATLLGTPRRRVKAAS